MPTLVGPDGDAPVDPELPHAASKRLAESNIAGTLMRKRNTPSPLLPVPALELRLHAARHDHTIFSTTLPNVLSERSSS